MYEAMESSPHALHREPIPYAIEPFFHASSPQVPWAAVDRPANSSQSSEGEEAELPPLLYARQNGLTRDHLKETLGWHELLRLQHRAAGAVYHDANLPILDLGTEPKIEERLTCSKEAALLLSCVANEAPAGEMEALVNAHFKIPASVRVKKLELPLLRTDHETDCRNWARREGFESKLRDIKLPLEATGIGEGMDWMSDFAHLGPQLAQELKRERLCITRDTMAFMQESLNIAWTEAEEKSLWDMGQTYRRKRIFEPITPPLSPLPVKPEPFEPAQDDPRFHVPILSDPISPPDKDLEALAREPFQQDISTPLQPRRQPDDDFSNASAVNVTLEEVYRPLASLQNSPAIADVKRVKVADLKVEEPMTPMPNPNFKSVRFSNIVEQLDIEPGSSPRSPPGQSSFFKETCGPAYDSVNQQLEQETLIPADTTARVEVPVMDFRKPDPPWHKFDLVKKPSVLLALQKSFLFETVGRIPTWPGARQKESGLLWSAINSDFANLALEEDYTADNDTWKTFMEDDQDVVDSSSLTWKPLGLKIVRDGQDDDDDEIESGHFRKDSPEDLSSLAKKRKLEMQERDNHRRNGPAGGGIIPAPRGSTATNEQKPAAYTQVPAMEHSGGGDFGILGSQFSAEDSLNHYLELRGRKRPKLADSNYFGNTIKAPGPGDRSLPANGPQRVERPDRVSPFLKREKLPVPTVAPSTTVINIIVSSSLLKNRALIKHLEAQLPSLKLIERDFTAHNTSAWMPGSVTRSPVKSPLDAEADFLLSPTTGIILTTLQKIRQKSLPGQNTPSAIRARLERVCPRYEKLFVFVSEGSMDESTDGLGPNDCVALAEFIGVACGFETVVNVHFVGGGDQTLAHWVAGLVVQHRTDTELLAEETRWEIFLRRAGLNAFAAQTIIADLKAAEGVDERSPSKAGLFGITAFVEMGREQRIARLGGRVGRNVLRRVSAVIDATWP